MDGCTHGMDAAWCYLCRIERGPADPRVAWGLGSSSPAEDELPASAPMTLGQATYLRSLCEEFEEPFDPGLRAGEAAIVIESFLDEPMTDAQQRTLVWLSEQAGEDAPARLTYGQARSKIRELVVRRGLRTA
ncbi:MAG TPA: DUF3072 domain-containing protein [Actinomycetota bacterium]|nr:DUF3072 domain-containing protein [Actinomycetota bacterium]